MKKIIIVLITLAVALTSVFAAEEPVIRYDSLDFTFQPTSARYDAMGQAGIANTRKIDSFFLNPSVLGFRRGFALTVPLVGITAYNIQPIISDPAAMANFNAMIKGDNDAMIPFLTQYFENLGTGHNMVTKIDTGLAVQLGVLGLGTNVQVKLHSLNNGTSVASLGIIPEINLAQTVALGLKIIDTHALSLSIGASVHGVYKAYFKAFSGTKVIELINSDDVQQVLTWETPIMGGWAIPVDTGVTLGLLNDTLTISATANNLNGTYHMKSYQGLGYLVNSYSENAIPGQPEGEVNTSVDFEIQTPWTLNFGATFAPDIIFHPVVSADLIDMFEMVKSFNKETFRASDLLLHLNAGAEVSLLSVLKVRAGVNRGFMSVGLGLWLPFAQIDAAYGWQEFGAELGDKTVDAFTIKVSIGYDK